MDWYIQLYETLPEHPKTYALAEALGIKQPHAVGLLVCLWIWAMRDAVSGDLSRYPDYAISNACRWDKSPKKLVQALMDCGWLDEDRRLHDWDEYAGEIIDRTERNRVQSRERQRKRRAEMKGASRGGNAEGSRDKPRNQGNCHEDVTRDKEDDERDSNADVTRDNRDGHAPNQNLYRNLGEEAEEEGERERPCARYCQENLAFMTEGHFQELRDFLESGMSDELVNLAVDAACGHQSRAWAYVKAVLNRWMVKGIRSVGEAKAEMAAFDAKKSSRGHSPPERSDKSPDRQPNPRLKFVD